MAEKNDDAGFATGERTISETVRARVCPTRAVGEHPQGCAADDKKGEDDRLLIRLRVMGYGLRVTGYGLWITGYGGRVKNNAKILKKIGICNSLSREL